MEKLHYSQINTNTSISKNRAAFLLFWRTYKVIIEHISLHHLSFLLRLPRKRRPVCQVTNKSMNAALMNPYHSCPGGFLPLSPCVMQISTSWILSILSKFSFFSFSLFCLSNHVLNFSRLFYRSICLLSLSVTLIIYLSTSISLVLIFCFVLYVSILFLWCKIISMSSTHSIIHTCVIECKCLSKHCITRK